MEYEALGLEAPFWQSQNEDAESIFCAFESKFNQYQIKKLVIDPGHGGRDNGCSGEESKEKHIALSVALQFGQLVNLYYPEVSVIYTRRSDVFVPLHRRAEIANEAKADLFISIHCNAMINADYINGSETYVLGLHRAEDNLDVAKRENAVILMEDQYESRYGYDPNSPAGHIVLSMFQGAYLEQSIILAQKIEDQIAGQTTLRSRGVKQAGFLVLRETTMPSVLVETGFLTNPKDNAYLKTARGQQSMANSLFYAFSSYKSEVENIPEPIGYVATVKRVAVPTEILTPKGAKAEVTTIHPTRPVVEEPIAARKPQVVKKSVPLPPLIKLH